MLGAARPGHPALRPRHDGRQRLAHRRRRVDARRRHGLARAPVRPRLRQRRRPTPSSPLTATSCARPPMSTPTCSGACAAAAATSGSWSSSSSGFTPSVRGLWSRSSRSGSIAPPQRCAAGATWPSRPPRQATLTAEISGDTVALGYVWVGDPRGRPRAAARAAQRRHAGRRGRARALLPGRCKPATTASRATRIGATGRATTSLTCPTARSRRSWTATRRTPRCPASASRLTAARSPTSTMTRRAFSHRRARFEYVAAREVGRPRRGQPADREPRGGRPPSSIRSPPAPTSTRSATRARRACAAPTPRPSARA